MPYRVIAELMNGPLDGHTLEVDQITPTELLFPVTISGERVESIPESILVEYHFGGLLVVGGQVFYRYYHRPAAGIT